MVALLWFGSIGIRSDLIVTLFYFTSSPLSILLSFLNVQRIRVELVGFHKPAQVSVSILVGIKMFLPENCVP